jgi:hypothetical protein
MNVIFWNNRGLGKKDRKQCLADTIRKHDVSFVGIQETKTREFSDNYLNSLTGRKLFCWKWLPSMGSARGILIGVDEDVLDVEKWTVRAFSVSCDIVRKRDRVKIRITTTYGPTYEEKKSDFIKELYDVVLEDDRPTVLGGVNLVRYQKDTSNGMVDFRWCDRYNEWIHKNSFLEIALMGRSFTWSNNEVTPIMSHIDRVFCNTDFDGIFPLAIARALPRNPSDHVPILWEYGNAQNVTKPRFKFEKWWLLHESFGALV